MQRFKIKSFQDVSDGILKKVCSSLANAIINNTVSVAVDANKWSSYKSGVFN